MTKQLFLDELNTLNENQLKAVKHDSGPLFVVAELEQEKQRRLLLELLI